MNERILLLSRVTLTLTAEGISQTGKTLSTELLRIKSSEIKT